MKIRIAHAHSPSCPCNNGNPELLYSFGETERHHKGGWGNGLVTWVVFNCNWDIKCKAKILVSLDSIADDLSNRKINKK